MTGGAGKVAHAELRIGDASIFVADEHPHYEAIVGPQASAGTPVYLDLETDDVAGRHDRAVQPARRAIRAPTDPAMAAADRRRCATRSGTSG